MWPWRPRDGVMLGAWMQNSDFGVGMEKGDVQINARYGQAGGDLTGSRPRANATWQGLMVARLQLARAAATGGKVTPP